jgi:hypothetical protein
MALFAGMAHDVHAGVTCTDAFGLETAASQGCGATYEVPDVAGGSGGGTYRAADPDAMPVVQNVLDWLYSLPARPPRRSCLVRFAPASSMKSIIKQVIGRRCSAVSLVT